MPGLYPSVDFDYPTARERWHRRQIATVVDGIMNGRINAVVDFDFGASGGVLSDPRIYPGAQISFTPLNAVAAANPAFADVASIIDGQATVTGGAAGAQYRVSILG